MKSMAGFLVFLLLVLVVLAGFLFMLNNEENVVLWLGREMGPLSLGFWVLGAFVGGGVSGLLVGYGLWSKLQLRLQMHTLRKQLQKEQQDKRLLEERLKRLEEIPGNADHGRLIQR